MQSAAAWYNASEYSIQKKELVMAIENKLAKLMRNSGPARFFVPVGIILIVFGIFMSGIQL